MALAAVVFAASALSAPRGSVPPLPSASTDLSPAEQSQRDYTAAQAALKSGDKKQAADLLEKALKEDSSNSAARERLREVDPDSAALSPAPQAPAEKKETPPAQEPAPVPPGKQWYDVPVNDLARLLPKTVSGFSAGQALAEGADAELPLDPANAANAALVSRVLLSVHDRGSSSAASRFVSTQLATLYPKAHAALKAGDTDARFGSDGAHYAAVIFSRGRFAYEVVLTSVPADPATLRGLADAIADAFPNKP